MASKGRPHRGPHIIFRPDRGRYYADVRDFAEVLTPEEHSGRIALKEKNEKLATTDPEVAQVLFARLLEELRERKRTHVATGRWKGTELKPYAAYHLVKKAQSGKAVRGWVRAVEHHLSVAVEFFGEKTDLAAICVEDVARFVEYLSQIGSGRRGPDGKESKLTPATQRKFLNSLSNLYRRAISEGHVPAGHNPVAGLLDKPTPVQHEARWLEVPDAALLLEACRTYQPNDAGPGETIPAAMLHALVATFLLTGGRMSEVFGLTVGDVSFERGRITFRTHPHRRLKTKTSARSVPLWPQLREILVPYVASLSGEDEDAPPPDALLFPSCRGTGMVRDIRKALDAAAGRVGWAPGEIRTKMFRHTYCAARLQTATRVLRPGAKGKARVQWIPVSQDQVARELGHGGTSLVAKVYGHIGDTSHRSECPEYLVGQHQKQLAPRLRLIEAA